MLTGISFTTLASFPGPIKQEPWNEAITTQCLSQTKFKERYIWEHTAPGGFILDECSLLQPKVFNSGVLHLGTCCPLGFRIVDKSSLHGNGTLSH